MSKLSEILEGAERVALESERAEKLAADLSLHRRFNNLHFRVLAWSPDAMAVRISQGRTTGTYFSNQDLARIAKEAFAGVAAVVHTRPLPYSQDSTYSAPEPEVVTAEWLDQAIEKSGLKLQYIEARTGIDLTSISAWRRGKKPMSETAKAAMFYFFRMLEATSVIGGQLN